MTTTVIKDWILDNAPDSATHYGGTNSDGFYLKKLIDRSGDCWFKCERDSYRWTKYQNIYRLDDIRSLSDIRRVVELEKEIKGTRVMERYDLIVKKVDGYASAKVEKHELGSFVKYVDVMEHIAELEKERIKLLSCLLDISNECIGEITMNYRVDSEFICGRIQATTGMTRSQLGDAVKWNGND